MRYYIDTEFIENGPRHPVRLISLAIVAEDGREYYAIDEDSPLHLASEWIKKNVIPHLDWMYARSRTEIITDVMNFVSGDLEPEFWGYYADYDWVVFAQLFGTMTNLPSNWPQYCLDVKQTAAMIDKNLELPNLSGIKEHHALWDAREIKFRHEWLMRRSQ